MNETVLNILLIFLFILIGGVFAAAEMALVSLRESQVKHLRTRGKRGEAVSWLASDPNLFLSAVQIGVTLSGFLSAAFGGATLADELTPVLVGWGVPQQAAAPIALVGITIVISYFSIVLGELTAKRLAMQSAESFALALAPMVRVIAKLARPLIWFLGVSTNVAVRLFGGDPAAAREEVSDEELRAMVSSSVTLGDEERQIVDEVFAAGQVCLREAMIPRTEVDFLDGDMPAYRALAEIEEKAHSRYPVVGRDVDDVLGFLHIRDLFDLDPSERNIHISRLVRPIGELPETVKILRALSHMQANNLHLIIVRDEYGGTAGIVTIEDLIEELIGDITDEYDKPLRPLGILTKGEIDGLTTLEEFAEQSGYLIPEGPYDTVAGFVMAQLGRLPAAGDTVSVVLTPAAEEGVPQAFDVRVTELDGRRASRLVVARRNPSGQPPDATEAGAGDR
ncbi:hemolysin family protein [Nigerium massiliense]|uniref:hemolysin family protein n=1 Tax=Nigerium massiliense TaxID=1522317 RepID=UPI00058E0DA8|nr:hemolysin family protein [Nigerium massiliense]